MRIERLTAAHVSPHLVDEMNRLLGQLSSNAPAMTVQRLMDLLAAPGVYVFSARDGDALAGMLTLIIAPIPSGFHGYIEDVVVDAEFRGRRIAEQLVRAALDVARDAGAEKVDLTSNPSREAANRLYARIGFERRETNVYRFAWRSIRRDAG